MSIHDLPTELLQIIFSNCHRSDQATISAVCRRWVEVLQPRLLRRICLKVSYDTKVPGPTRYGVIDKTVLIETDRQYTGFRVEWGYRDTDRNKQVLKELLDVCQERFPVQRLYLSAPPQRRMARFFVDRCQWLQSLVELSVTLRWSKPAGCELSLPSLKQLTWCEPRSLEMSDRPFILTAPELYRLKIVSNIDLKRENSDHRILLSCLRLKSCPKLEDITIERISKLDQCHVESFEPFLRQLKVLSLYDCEPDVVTRLCGKCTNLKELTIRQIQVNYNMLHLQISPVLSHTLENLTLLGVKYPHTTLAVHGRATFSKLKRFCMNTVAIDLDMDTDVRFSSIAAPQLVTFIAGSSNLSWLTLQHEEQIRTMKVDLEDRMTICPPNVTELYLRLPASVQTSEIQRFLENFPNLTRLTLSKTLAAPRTLECTFVERLPKLESFAAYQLTFRLTVCENFANLKSLILSNCFLISLADDDPVQLTALEYVRIEQVTIDSHSRVEQFPIRVNERQPPVQIVSSDLVKHQTVFSSSGFKSTIREELVPDFMGDN